MKQVFAHTAGAIALTIATAACVPAPESTPTPSPAPTPTAVASAAPSPTPVPAAPSGEWIDRPQTAGEWVYGVQGANSFASFRQPDGKELLQLTCQRDVPIILLTRKDVVAGQVTIRTETMDQVVRVPPTSGPPTETIATMGVRWPLLDAMALTRGRFAVETAGAPTLYLPAWAEVTRVIEDCR